MHIQTGLSMNHKY